MQLLPDPRQRHGHGAEHSFAIYSAAHTGTQEVRLVACIDMIWFTSVQPRVCAQQAVTPPHRSAVATFLLAFSPGKAELMLTRTAVQDPLAHSAEQTPRPKSSVRLLALHTRR